MKVRASFAWVRELAWLLLGSGAMRAVVNDAAKESRRHRPFGPEVIPEGVPPDIPVYSRRGFRQLPSYKVEANGSLRLSYMPRDDFEPVVTFCELQLQEHGWAITEAYDDVGEDFRARRFDISKEHNRGSAAITESIDQIGPIELRQVKVSIDLQPTNQPAYVR